MSPFIVVARPLRRALERGAILALGATALFIAGVVVFQDRLLYFPDNPPPADLLDEARRHGLRVWSGADDFRAFRREPATPGRGTIVILHGNAGHAAHRAWYADVYVDNVEDGKVRTNAGRTAVGNGQFVYLSQYLPPRTVGLNVGFWF